MKLTRSTEYQQRRMLREHLGRLSHAAQLAMQLQAESELEQLPEGSEERHWAAHRFINIVAWRSFGRLDVPCQHREDLSHVSDPHT